MKNLNHSSRAVKHGMYSTLCSVIVIAIVIVFNIILSQLPSSAVERDMTAGDLYTMSKTSSEYLSGLDSNIELTILAESGSVDQRLMKFIYNYAAASPKISIKEVDPVRYPSALDTYGVGADNVIITNSDTGKNTSIQLYGYDGMDKAMLLYDYARYYQTGVHSAVSFDADGLLTSAIDYVTGDKTGTVYLLSGHGEAELSASAQELVEKANLGLESVDLLMDGGVPEDCGLLLSVNPSTDLADDELEILKKYLQSGGNVMLIIDNGELKNFAALLKEYGLEMQDGFVGDTSRYFSNYASYYGYYCISPELDSSNSITAKITANAMLLYPHGMRTVEPGRSGVEISSFMTTSDKGFVYHDEENIENDRYILGAVATETLEDEDKISRLIVVSTPTLVDENLTSTITSLANLDIFINAVTSCFDGISAVTIPAKSMTLTYNTISGTSVWSALFIGAIPLALIIYGLYYWTKRRKQ